MLLKSFFVSIILMTNEQQEEKDQISQVRIGGHIGFLRMMGVEEDVLNGITTEDEARTLIELMNGLDENDKKKIIKKDRNANVKPADEKSLNSQPVPVPNPHKSTVIINSYTKDAYLPHFMILPGSRVLRLENKNGRMIL